MKLQQWLQHKANILDSMPRGELRRDVVQMRRFNRRRRRVVPDGVTARRCDRLASSGAPFCPRASASGDESPRRIIPRAPQTLQCSHAGSKSACSVRGASCVGCDAAVCADVGSNKRFRIGRDFAARQVAVLLPSVSGSKK